MYKQVMLLGLLLEKPMYGQQIREVIELHHDTFAGYIKKPTIYYQLERLVHDGYLEARSESVEAPGPGMAHDAMALREREVYYITEVGRQHFYKLLRESLRVYTPGPSDIDVSFFFLHHLSPNEATALLSERRRQLANYRASIERQTPHESDEAHAIVNDHMYSLLDAELGWLDRTIERLQAPRPK